MSRIKKESAEIKKIKNYIPSGMSSIFSEARNGTITAKLQQALPRGRAKQDVTYIRMMHYTGTLPTFARFLRRELYALSANRNISSRDFPETVVAGSVTHFANSCATGTCCPATVHLRGDDRMNRNHVRKSCSRISST